MGLISRVSSRTYRKMADKFKNKSKNELIDIILKLEQEKANLLSENKTYRLQIDELEDAVENSKNSKIDKPNGDSTNSRNSSTESSDLEKIKQTSLEKLKITKLEQEKIDISAKLAEQKKLTAKHLSDKVKLHKEIDDLKKKSYKIR